MPINTAMLQFGVSLARDLFVWYEERRARGLNTAPTDEEILARVKGKIAAGIAEGEAALEEFPEEPPTA